MGLTGCRRPELHGVPYSKGVEWQIPGNALHYATSMPRRGGALPLIATTYNGRPTKLEGNPNVPGFNGSTDRLRPGGGARSLRSRPLQGRPQGARIAARITPKRTWDDFWEEFAILRNDYLKNGGEGLAILAEPSTSPTRERMRRRSCRQQFPEAALGRVRAVGEPGALQSSCSTI